MSTIIIRMQQHQVDELGSCIEQGLRHFGRAMSIYEDMKHASQEEYGERTYPHMMGRRTDYPHYFPEDEAWDEMRPRHGMRYSRY